MPQLFANTIQQICHNHSVSIPFVSVVVVTYNHEDWIEECLEGILNQNFQEEIELLLVDHSSSDGTFEKAVSFWKARRGGHATFIKKDRANMKRVNGRPTGNGNFIEMVMKARGKYVAVCSGDDVWIDPQKLTKQIGLFMEFKGTTIVWSDTIIGPDVNQAKPSIGNRTYIQLSDYRYHNINGDAASTALFRKDSLNLSVFAAEFSSVPYEDWSLHMLCLENGHGIRLSEPTTLYRHHANNMMKSVLDEWHLIEWVQSLNYYSDYFQQLDYSELRSRIEEKIVELKKTRISGDLKSYVHDLPFGQAMSLLFKRATTRILQLFYFQK